MQCRADLRAEREVTPFRALGQTDRCPVCGDVTRNSDLDRQIATAVSDRNVQRIDAIEYDLSASELEPWTLGPAGRAPPISKMRNVQGVVVEVVAAALAGR